MVKKKHATIMKVYLAKVVQIGHSTKSLFSALTVMQHFKHLLIC